MMSPLCHNDGRVQFHEKSAIFHSQYLYQILQLSNHTVSQILIWQKASLPRSPVAPRPIDPVQARGRDTGTGTHGERGQQAQWPSSPASPHEIRCDTHSLCWLHGQISQACSEKVQSHRPSPIFFPRMHFAITSFMLALAMSWHRTR